jgi:hypothetical protein
MVILDQLELEINFANPITVILINLIKDLKELLVFMTRMEFK